MTVNQFLQLGNTLQKQGELHEAIECYRQAVKLKSYFPEAHDELAKLLQFPKLNSKYFEFLKKINCNNVMRSPWKYIQSLHSVFEEVECIEGEIIELGVARGRNTIIFGNLIKNKNSLKKYIGFDTFSGYTEEDILTAPNEAILRKIKQDGVWNGSKVAVETAIANAGLSHICSLIEGDLKQTLPEHVKVRSNFKISLLYVDCNAYLAALSGMEIAKDYLSPGAIICIDEHTIGGETKALKEFAVKNNQELIETGDKVGIPMYIVWQPARLNLNVDSQVKIVFPSPTSGDFDLSPKENREEILKTINRFGLVRIPSYMGYADIANLKDEFFSILNSNDRGLRPLDYPSGQGVVIDRYQFNKERFPLTAQVFGDPWMAAVTDLFLGKPNHLNFEIFAALDLPQSQWNPNRQSDPSIVKLHYDKLLTLKFYLYLEDTTAKNGAIECVPGSHTLTREMVNRHLRNGGSVGNIPNQDIPADAKPIPIEGKAGTLIIFTTDTFHRAGYVSEGQRRLVMRGHSRTEPMPSFGDRLLMDLPTLS
jgi:hypothetical protein